MSRYVTEDGFTLLWDEVAPRRPEERYRLYRVRDGGAPELLATTATLEGVGVAIGTLGREQEWKDAALGLLDTEGEVGQKWIVTPWCASPREVSDAARVMARNKKTSRRG